MITYNIAMAIVPIGRGRSNLRLANITNEVY